MVLFNIYVLVGCVVVCLVPLPLIILNHSLYLEFCLFSFRSCCLSSCLIIVLLVLVIMIILFLFIFLLFCFLLLITSVIIYIVAPCFLLLCVHLVWLFLLLCLFVPIPPLSHFSSSPSPSHLKWKTMERTSISFVCLWGIFAKMSFQKPLLLFFFCGFLLSTKHVCLIFLENVLRE